MWCWLSQTLIWNRWCHQKNRWITSRIRWKNPHQRRKSQSFSRKKTNGENTSKPKSLKSMDKKFWKTKNGPKNKNNTTKPNTSSKKLRPSSLKLLNPTLSYKKETPPSLKYLPTSLNTPKLTSKDNLGPKSSTFWLKSPLPLPFKLMDLSFKKLSTFVTPY